MHQGTENPYNSTDTAFYHKVAYTDSENTRSNDSSTNADVINYCIYTITDVFKHGSIKSHFSSHLLYFH
ncbi:hypothetical protein [Methanosarcina siciliae]|uniref:hypothetical protein n=1 Tax=Methanosarcina siciliae TaxID=38027 RepID=UPI0012E05198|nr:hypothetical protein [Methanosarcina siciliae]